MLGKIGNSVKPDERDLSGLFVSYKDMYFRKKTLAIYVKYWCWGDLGRFVDVMQKEIIKWYLSA